MAGPDRCVMPSRSADQRGQKDERDGLEARRDRRQAGEQFEPRQARHADVAKHQIGSFPQDRGKAFLPVIGKRDGKAAIGEFLGDQGRRFAFVFDTEDPLAEARHD